LALPLLATWLGPQIVRRSVLNRPPPRSNTTPGPQILARYLDRTSLETYPARRKGIARVSALPTVAGLGNRAASAWL
jgi:hypothetical protein